MACPGCGAFMLVRENGLLDFDHHPRCKERVTTLNEYQAAARATVARQNLDKLAARAEADTVRAEADKR